MLAGSFLVHGRYKLSKLYLGCLNSKNKICFQGFLGFEELHASVSLSRSSKEFEAGKLVI